MMSSTVLVDGLSVDRGGRAVLHDLSCRLGPGEVVGLLGPSGCGKTTLIRSIVGVQRIRLGSVTVLGQPAGSPGLRARVGYMTQSLAVYTDLGVRENLRYFAAILGAPPERVDEVIAQVDLTDHAQSVVARMSGGQQARVSLAVALLGQPEVLVLDEPTVGLDPVLREELWRHFHRLADAGATLLVSSHVMDEAARCSRLLLMRDGRLMADSTPDELCRRTGARSVEDAFLRLVGRAGVAA
jgi:ABC-2 type transport system ATP-binding protein